MARRTADQPEQQAPPVQRLRVHYAKRGSARFTSHRDFARAFERALNRARIPMSYSSGFHPHPRISYASASATGAASEAEYLEIGLSARCDPARVADGLGESLPTGMVVLRVAETDRTAFTELLTASAWLIEPGPETDLGPAVEDLMTSASHLVTRMTKSGPREFDVRSAVIGMDVHEGAVRLMLRHLTPLVRPDDILTALARSAAGLDPADCRCTRLAQGRPVDPDDGVFTDLLDPFDGEPRRVWRDASTAFGNDCGIIGHR
ncbi:TIGR03936 family radical SAM-associated protein [Acidipropionibacterium acidipropionici]|uniref:TIGR03936 family radical SAM-associated protein n=1 Tax=Acidipropionibacterium acidipropionici TaxID=1748 RepID=UPI0009DB824E|nr:TIGR03936 family radical SAM-associated protein [Acidipropionibacterium acidipropionici]